MTNSLQKHRFFLASVTFLAVSSASGKETSTEALTSGKAKATENSGDWCIHLPTKRYGSFDDTVSQISVKDAQVQADPPLQAKKSPYYLSTKPLIWYDESKGFRLQSKSPHADLWIGARFQWRSTNLPGNINSPNSLDPPPGGEGDLKLRRGRVKGGGTIFSDKLTIYSEYNFPTETLLDYRVTYAFTKNLRLRFGQWKSDYNRERVDSSGKQQLVERSISNYWFTIDRQTGASLYFRLGEGSACDSSIWIEYLTARGRGAGYEGDSSFWMGRWQWNPQGKELSFSQSDLKRSEEFISSVAIAALHGNTPFTRFSGGGGGQLPGYAAGDYRLTQAVFETAAHYRGWSWQQELHVKDIEDRNTGRSETLLGGYAQVGTFPSEYCSWVPDPLEFVLRYSLVDPETSLSGNNQTEWTFGINWYFNGHRNKLNADVSLLDIDDPTLGDDSDVRFRLQWERSF